MRSSAGTTLIEVLIAIGILAVLSLTIASSFSLFFQALGQKNHRLEAAAIANQTLEQIRNLPYEQIGLLDGNPAGDLLANRVINRQGVNFTVQTDIVYHQPAVADYKKVTISVTFPGALSNAPVQLSSDFAPLAE